MNVTYDYYRIFYYVAKYGSFTKAAQVLKNSQPNITRAMNNLEAQLDISLFARSKKGIKLTTDGEHLFERIRPAFDLIFLAESEIESTRNHESGTITVGVSDIALYEVLLDILPDMREKYPNISIKITNESTPSAIKKLKEEVIDFALVTAPLSVSRSFKSVELMEIHDCATVSKDFKSYKEEDNTLESLTKYPLIMLAEGTGTRSFYEDLFSKNSLELRPQMTVATINQVLIMVKKHIGIGFLPETILNMDDEFKKIELKEPIPKRSICLVYDKERLLSGAAQTILNEIKGHFMA